MPQQQRQQLPFGGMQQIGANGPPSFPHDPSQGLQNAQPPFGNAPGGQTFANPMQMQALARNQNQMFSNQGESMRQLNLMLAQNPQNQNGIPQNPMAAFQRLPQSQPQQHPQQSQPSLPQHSQGMGGSQLPPGLFVGPMNPSMSSNIAGNFQANGMAQARQNGMMPPHGMQDSQAQQQQQRRQINLKELHEKAQLFKTAIQQGELRIKSLQSQHPTGAIPPDHLAEISKTQKEIDLRRNALGRIMQIVQTINNGGNPGVASGGMPLSMNL